jgi:monoamine oxidase
MQTVDVVVVGAGISGLVAARRLHEGGVRTMVLEARDRVGGRTLSQRLGADTIDLGAQWIGPTQDRIAALVAELGIDTFEQYHAGRKVLELDGRRRTYAGFLPKLGLLPLCEMGLMLPRLERLARRVPLEAPWRAAKAQEWDAQSVAGWLKRSLRTRGARQMLRIATHSIFAEEPERLSFLFFLFYLHSGGGLRRLGEVQGGAQQTRVIGGMQQISERLAARLEGGVRLQCAVEAIEQDESGVIVRGAGEAVRARRVVLALPPALTGHIVCAPELPLARRRLQQQMPMGSVIKCIAQYERPFWREAGLSGEALAGEGLVRLVFDDSSHDAAQANLVAFVFGDEARRASEMPAEQRRQQVLGALARLLGEPARSPVAYVDKDWPADPYSGGCYVGVTGPGVLSELGSALREPCGRLHFAGTETATRWMGYMDGAVEAGERAAQEVLEALAAEPRVQQ